MATTTAATAAATVTKFQGAGRQVCVQEATYAVTVAPVLNDVVELVRLPAGSVVVDVTLRSSDMDTNGTPLMTMSVGYGGDDDYMIAASTVGRTGGVARADAVTFVPLTLAAEDTIDLKWSAAAATFAAGSVTLSVYYYSP